jgi:DUF1680 family protein
MLRITGWAEGATATVNGDSIDVAANTRSGYLTTSRDWRASDVVELDLPMQPRRVFANPKVRMDQDRVTLKRGPLVYCLEQVDNPIAVPDLVLPRSAGIAARERVDLFDGITVRASHIVLRVGADASWYRCGRT